MFGLAALLAIGGSPKSICVSVDDTGVYGGMAVMCWSAMVTVCYFDGRVAIYYVVGCFVYFVDLFAFEGDFMAAAMLWSTAVSDGCVVSDSSCGADESVTGDR